MNIKNQLGRAVFTLAVLTTCSGCPAWECGKVQLSYKITSDLKIKLATIRILNLHPIAADPQKTKAAMENFYNEDYFETAAELRRHFSSQAYVTTLLNTQETSCDVQIFAKKLELFEAASIFSEGALYTISRGADNLLIQVIPKESSKGFLKRTPVEVTIVFKGKIVEQNAHTFDEATGTMQWQVHNLGSDGIRFVLAIPQNG